MSDKLDLKKHIRDVEDFPIPGIKFRDITSLIETPEPFRKTCKELTKMTESFNADLIVSIESRGFIFAGSVSTDLLLPFVLARKPGKLPNETYVKSFDLEYGSTSIEIQKNTNIEKGQRIVIIDDLVATGGTVLASKLAINYGISCNTAGGSHHASYDGGAGYCVFNDVAVAAHYLLNRGLANRILIVDLDVHQGNGNSEIFRDNRSVFTFSMHSKTNYPAKKSNSDLDVELEDNLEDDAYIKTLKHYLKELNQENFDFIFYIAGVDIHFNDRLGKLKISDEGIKLRDELVVENFFSRRIPFCGVLGGGYNKDFNKLVELHSLLHQSCAKYIGS